MLVGLESGGAGAESNETVEVVLTSSNLNMTVQARPATALAEEPIAIKSTTVSLPSAVLSVLPGNGSVGLLLYVSALNTHGTGGRRRRARRALRELTRGRRLSEASELETSSSMVSFSLRQGGQARPATATRTCGARAPAAPPSLPILARGVTSDACHRLLARLSPCPTWPSRSSSACRSRRATT